MAKQSVSAPAAAQRQYLPADLINSANRDLLQAGGVVSLALAAINGGEGYSDEDVQNALWLVQEKLASVRAVVNARPSGSTAAPAEQGGVPG